MNPLPNPLRQRRLMRRGVRVSQCAVGLIELSRASAHVHVFELVFKDVASDSPIQRIHQSRQKRRGLQDCRCRHVVASSCGAVILQKMCHQCRQT